MEQDFLHIFKLREGRFRVDTKKNFFTLRHWNSLTTKAVEALSPELFNTRFDGALSNLMKGVSAHGRGYGTGL